MGLKPVHENLYLLRECRTILLDHAEGLIDVFLDVRVWIACGDDTLGLDNQRVRPVPQSRYRCSLYPSHVQHPGGQIPKGNDYRNCPVARS